MQVIQRMNKKLDSGWKLTNSNCQKCNGVTLADPSNLAQYYCPKCDKIFEFKQDEQESIENENQPSSTYQQQTEQDYFNEVIASSGVFSKKETSPKAPSLTQNKQSLSQYSYQRKQQRSNDVSKKLGQKLLHGWTMLEQSCPGNFCIKIDCNVPLMKSKKGQKLCLGCDKDYAAIQADKQKKPAINNFSQPQVAPKVQVQPVKNSLQNNPQQNSFTAQKIASSNQKPTSSSQLLIQNIECKALRFLEFKMDKAIDENDIGAVQRLISIIQTIKK